MNFSALSNIPASSRDLRAKQSFKIEPAIMSPAVYLHICCSLVIALCFIVLQVSYAISIRFANWHVVARELCCSITSPSICTNACFLYCHFYDQSHSVF